MTREQAAQLSRAVNPAMLTGVLNRTYTEAVERGTLDWDTQEADDGSSVLEVHLRGESTGPRW
jgi:hypothetical protein